MNVDQPYFNHTSTLLQPYFSHVDLGYETVDHICVIISRWISDSDSLLRSNGAPPLSEEFYHLSDLIAELVLKHIS